MSLRHNSHKTGPVLDLIYSKAGSPTTPNRTGGCSLCQLSHMRCLAARASRPILLTTTCSQCIIRHIWASSVEVQSVLHTKPDATGQREITRADTRYLVGSSFTLYLVVGGVSMNEHLHVEHVKYARSESAHGRRCDAWTCLYFPDVQGSQGEATIVYIL